MLPPNFLNFLHYLRGQVQHAFREVIPFHGNEPHVVPADD
jgi:hypothetical protein